MNMTGTPGSSEKDGIIIGHLPRKVLRLCSLFLRRGGCISCVVTGRRQYLADLLQGGLESKFRAYFFLEHPQKK